MATQTKPNDIFDVQGAFERITEANRKAGNDYVDLYEKTVGQLTALELKDRRGRQGPRRHRDREDPRRRLAQGRQDLRRHRA